MRAQPRLRSRSPRGRRHGRSCRGELPSVAIQSRPWLSTAQLSGMPNQPFFVVAARRSRRPRRREGSPHFTRMSQRELRQPHGRRRPASISTMWPKRLSARGLAASTWSALRRAVVGQHDIDLAGLRIGLDVLGPVHLGRAEQIGGAAGLDQHVGLAGEAVRRGQRALAEDQRQPGAACRRRRTGRRRACRRRAGRGWRRGSRGRRAPAVTNL